MNFVQVLLPFILDYPLTYNCIDAGELQIGQLVEVTLRSKLTIGIVWSKSEQKFEGKVKPILNQLPIILSSSVLQFIEKFAHYNIAPLGWVAKQVLSLDHKDLIKISQLPKLSPFILDLPSIQLSESQLLASQKIHQNLGAFSTFLLDGVTGSGKTEVFLEAVTSSVKQGYQVLILMPEIALSTHFMHRFNQNLQAPLMWHSKISVANKRKVWQHVVGAKPMVVVGARSALFLPFNNLGLIIVDEEHDNSYKQEEQILYNARNMAVLRGSASNSTVVLVSATPSLETLYNATSGRYKHLTLSDRFGVAQMPAMHIIDKKTDKHPKSQWLSKSLIKAMEQKLKQKQQTLLFLNRRGYAPLTFCKSCGYRFTCKHCDICLVQHKRTNKLHCHYCDFTRIIPSNCPNCNEDNSFIVCGLGVEKIQEEIEGLFPKARLLVVTSDLINTAKKAEIMVDDILQQKVDIIIGTQMLAKGHHFPNLTLVGVIDADLSLQSGDLRAAEKNFQLLHQVSGRCGRAEQAGEVYIQTFYPDNPIIQALAAQDRDSFVNLELSDRKTHNMPPFGRLTAFIFSSKNESLVEKAAMQFTYKIPNHPHITILGPISAPLNFLQGKYRWRLLLKYPNNFAIQSWIKSWLPFNTIDNKVRLIIDVDPQSFM